MNPSLPGQSGAEVHRLRFGIEAEYLVLGPDGRPADVGLSEHTAFQRVIDRLPDHADPELTRGDLAIKWARWYVEGDERFDAAGSFLRCVPKGIETRTPICAGIEDVVRALSEQTRQLQDAASVDGYRLAAIGRHPERDRYRPDPAFNAWELAMRGGHREYAAPEVYMCTFGPDVNLSHPGWSPQDCLRVGARLARLAPALVMFSLNAPFDAGRRWDGYSARTFARAGRRPSVRVFLADPGPEHEDGGGGGLEVCPARLPTEHGRIEFKAFDAFGDLGLFGSLTALLAGVALAPADRVPPPPRAWQGEPVAAQLRQVARAGMQDDALRAWSGQILDLARTTLGTTTEAMLLGPLQRAVDDRRVPADELIETQVEGQPIVLPALRHPAARPGTPAPAER